MNINNISEYLPILIPLVILQFTLAIIALFSIYKSNSYKIGNRIIWTLLSCFLSIIGPILYFTLGRDDS